MLVQGDRRSCQEKIKSVNLFIFSGEGPRICAKWELITGIRGKRINREGRREEAEGAVYKGRERLVSIWDNPKC